MGVPRQRVLQKRVRLSRDRRQRLAPWLGRISDDVWSATQLLALFFLGATVLCVPPRLHPPAVAETKAIVEVSAAPLRPDAGPLAVAHSAARDFSAPGAVRVPGNGGAVR